MASDTQGALQSLQLTFDKADQIEKVKKRLSEIHSDDILVMEWTNATLSMKKSEWETVVEWKSKEEMV